MSHKIKIYIISMGLILLGATQLCVFGPNVSAQCTPRPNDPLCPIPPTTPPTPSTVTHDVDCPSGKATADGSGCQPLGNGCKGVTSGRTCLSRNPIFNYVNTAVTFFSGLVGVVVVAVIIIGGIQYSMAGDNSTAVQEARKKITNGLIALIAFLFLFAFLQWLVPGGLL